MIALYQTKQIRKLEAYTINNQIVSEYDLMLTAGQKAGEMLFRHWPNAKRLLVCCGKGNNAGDGYVLARFVHEQGREVKVIALSDPNQLTGSANKAYQSCLEAGVDIKPYSDDVSWQADLIVDAILGTGLKGDVQEPFASVISMINDSSIPVFAIDIPSGLNADTGSIQGVSIKANATITFIALKQGMFTAKAAAHCGKIECDSLGIPKEAFDQVKPTAEVIEWETVQKMLPRRSRVAHKGEYGHVLVIGGDYGMGGAVRMASEAALRVGAGLVSVATRPEHVAVVNSSRPEIMCHQISVEEDIEPLLAKASVIVIGPGLGQSDWAKSLLARVIKSDLPKLLDADALNLLSQHPKKSDSWILTPHPGEAARLLNQSCQGIQTDRFASAKALQSKFSGVTVLKGAGTIIQSENQVPKVCAAGNPGMASGGMGDVLSGIIGGLMAQGLGIIQAAEAGVLVHAKSADMAASKGGERGLLATDLMEYVRELVNPTL